MSTYLSGFTFSVILTLAAFSLLQFHSANHIWPTHLELMAAFVALAMTQLLVQLIFFLHLGRGKNRGWSLTLLGITFAVVCILVGGTLWIMSNLAHGMAQSMPYNNGTITPQMEQD